MNKRIRKKREKMLLLKDIKWKQKMMDYIKSKYGPHYFDRLQASCQYYECPIIIETLDRCGKRVGVKVVKGYPSSMEVKYRG